MKLYKIYLVQFADHSQLEPLLYAFTDKKRYVNKFMKLRNKEVFRVIEKPEAKEEFQRLSHFSSTLMLKDIPLITSTDDDLQKTITIHIIGTRREENEVAMTIEGYTDIWRSCFKANPNLFNEKYREALELLLYDGLYNWARCDPAIPFYDENDFEMIHFYETKGRSIDKFRYDEFAIFLERFGATIDASKKKG